MQQNTQQPSKNNVLSHPCCTEQRRKTEDETVPATTWRRVRTRGQ